MSNTVTIRGRIATTRLRAGEVVTVEHTDAVQALIERGYVTVVDAPDTGGSLVGTVTPDAGADEPQEDVEDVEEGPVPPARSASKADWQEFLDGQGILVDADLTRDELVALWHE